MSWKGRACDEEAEGASYWSACPLCPCAAHGRAPDPRLLRCAACRLVFYCSASHQRHHWPRHRRLCAAAARYRGASGDWPLFSGFFPGAEEGRRWAEVRLRAALCVEVRLGRSLQPNERDLFFFPRVCEVCKRSEGEECARCRCVIFCGAEHRAAAVPRHPPALCRALAAARRLDLCPCEPGAPAQLAEDYARAWPWERGVPADVLSLRASEHPEASEEELAASELLSGPLTLAAALLRAQGWAEAEAEAEVEVEVRVAGAAALEAAAPGVWELLLHALAHRRPRGLRRLRVVLVGPDLPPGPQEDAWTLEVDVCDACAALGRSLALHFHRTLYHSFLAVKVKAIPQQAPKAPWGFTESRAPQFLDLGTRRRRCGQHHAPAALTPGKTWAASLAHAPAGSRRLQLRLRGARGR